MPSRSSSDSVPNSPSSSVAPFGGQRSNARRKVGEQLEPFTLETLSHGMVSVPNPDWVHLQFRRFTGCPVCNLHLRSFAKQHERLVSAGIRTIAFFHSPRQSMLSYQAELPFAVVPDPERRWYRLFGTERSSTAVLHPRVMSAAVRGLFSGPSNPLNGGSDQTQLPADFLLDGEGRIRALHYGAHANDQWEVDDLLRWRG